jgi:hypothetical protein
LPVLEKLAVGTFEEEKTLASDAGAISSGMLRTLKSGKDRIRKSDNPD